MQIIKDIKDIDIKDSMAITIGNFDGVHKGHQFLIQEITNYAKENKIKSGLVTFQSHTKTLLQEKKVHRILTLEDRYKFVESLGVDFFIEIPFHQISDLSYMDFIQQILKNKLKSKYLVIGDDFRFGKNRKGDAKTLKQVGKILGFEVLVKEKIRINNKIISSTLIRELIKNGDIKFVNEMLGRRYFLKGKVIHGHKLGRKLGFPTANLLVDSSMAIPNTGVYATCIDIEGEKFLGATNIGFNPTISNREFSVESFIINFDGYLYDQDIKVEFLEKIRDEQKFESLNMLVDQMKKDVEHIKNSFTCL